MVKIKTLDTTLRDGAGSLRVSFSSSDKIKIVTLLDSLGVDYIEAGNPASNIKDAEFFKMAQYLSLKNSKLAAFGSTCRVGAKPENDSGLKALAECSAKVCVIFGKAWNMHVKDVLGTTPEENLRIIRESIEYLKKCGKEVIFDAEHFYNGFTANRDYALSVLKTAQEAGSDVIVLCDTNGGMFPEDIYEITKEVCESFDCEIGIHTHNDSGLAVANTQAAVNAGATHVQGTLNGVGERCGNANLSTVIANLQIKRDYSLIPEQNLKKLTEISRQVADISNIRLDSTPYVSREAFAHKAGMHIDGMIKNALSFEHIDPAMVGNERNFLASEISGRSGIIGIVHKVVPGLQRESEEVKAVLARLKELENAGYQFDTAEASLILVIQKVLGIYKKYFEINICRLTSEQSAEVEGSYTSVLIKARVGENEEITAAESDGPVHAMDIAIRKALEKFYPCLKDTRLTDYKVRVLNSEAATGATTRVLIETTDRDESWTTVGVSTSVIEASLRALVDSIEYKLQKNEMKGM